MSNTMQDSSKLIDFWVGVSGFVGCFVAFTLFDAFGSPYFWKLSYNVVRLWSFTFTSHGFLVQIKKQTS